MEEAPEGLPANNVTVVSNFSLPPYRTVLPLSPGPTMAGVGEDVYCTLVMSDSYLPGAAVLAHSLRDAGTTKKLAALITLDTLSASSITELKELYDYLLPVDRIRNPNPANLYLMDRADLSFAFTKIHLWRQTQFRKIVYVDADVVVLRAPDELFDIDAPFAAAPDVGWPDAFNTGVMVLSPNMGDYWALQTMAATGDSFDGADQGLLNQYYEHRNWHRIRFTYNTTPNAQYQWEPAYRYYKRDISMVHFIGKDKPWIKGRKSAPGSGVYNELLSRWWAVYDRHLKLPDIPSTPTHTSNTVQKHVQGEYAASSTAPGIAVDRPEIVESEAAALNEEPMSESGESFENLDQDPIAEQPQFSAPQMEWDATRSAPPLESKPEAANFPTQQYEFNESRQLFHPPKSYPEPPKDMWYEVPKEKPAVKEQPAPIFPWERERHIPKATRVFAEDLPSPQATPTQAQPTNTRGPHPMDQFTAHTSPDRTPQETWQSMNQSVNAWDSVPGISQYIRAVMEPKKNFPSAIERPSLPVTPAPIKRPTFWGEDKDTSGELPTAEGVPDQADWNPEEKLNQLRRSSLLEFEYLKSPPTKQVPLRELPGQGPMGVKPQEETKVPVLKVSMFGDDAQTTSSIAADEPPSPSSSNPLQSSARNQTPKASA